MTISDIRGIIRINDLGEITTVVVLKASAKYPMQRTTCVQCGKVLAWFLTHLFQFFRI
jgi:hypothetical protein